jgi:lipopolysaccharide/colanic/teichoic acid biosynthesis glycosyltransferase
MTVSQWTPAVRALRGAPAHRRAGIGPGGARRALDILVAVLGLAVLGVPLLLLMFAVRVESPGPALFRQVRIGQGGRPFTLYKLRSMQVGAGGPEVTAGADPRVTWLGQRLRSAALDELPQLWNVLRGQMTLVGARPETVALAARYPAACRWVFAYRPGLTGPAQVRLRDSDLFGGQVAVDTGVYLERVVSARAAIEARYLSDPTLHATIDVLADTVRHLIGRPVPVR